MHLSKSQIMTSDNMCCIKIYSSKGFILFIVIVCSVLEWHQWRDTWYQ
jgi:hypothetical protein